MHLPYYPQGYYNSLYTTAEALLATIAYYEVVQRPDLLLAAIEISETIQCRQIHPVHPPLAQVLWQNPDNPYSSKPPCFRMME